MVFHEDVVSGNNVGGSLQSKTGVPVAEHHVLFDGGIQSLGTPSKDTGPAVPVHHVIAEVGQRNKGTDTRGLVIQHVAVVDVGSGVFTKDTFETVPDSEVRHFGARSTHDGRTISATIDDRCERVFTFQDHIHHQGNVFVIGATLYQDGIASIRIAKSVGNL